MERIDSRRQINHRAGFFYLAMLLSGVVFASDKPMQLDRPNHEFNSELKFTALANRDAIDYFHQERGRHGYARELASPYTPRDTEFVEASVLQLIGHAAIGESLAALSSFQFMALRVNGANAWVSTSNVPQSFDELLDHLKPRWTSTHAPAGSGASSLEPMATAPSMPLTKIDALLMGLVGVGLVAYQLRRKQRSLRQSPFALT